MGKHHLRKDMTCMNCRQVVEKRYCPNCGQENTDTRKTFHHLFVHFFEDLTHYENAFWKTIRNLLFRPGSLTTEYMSGKRMSYLAPVRLYIFISFITFFLLGVLPKDEYEDSDAKKSATNNNINIVSSDSEKAKVFTDSVKKIKMENGLTIGEYSSLKQFDSVQKTLPESKRATGFSKWIQRRLAKVNGETTPQEFRKEFSEAIVHNLPKALFLYMPFFAFFVWLFHNKKRWYYFDHGIFTLHYFSFLLITLSIFLVIDSLTSFIGEELNDLANISVLLMMIWWFFYFFRSHSRFYGESKAVSRLKSIALFFINVFFLIFFVVCLMVYTALYLD